MVYYISDLFFGDETVARRRHYSSASDMNNDIVSNWNKVVCDSDTVYILGGIGDFSFVKSLNGEKILVISDREKEHMLSYVSGICSVRDSEYDSDMYSWYLKSGFGISSVNYTGKLVRKSYSGRLIRLSTDRSSVGNGVFTIVGGMDNEFQRLFDRGLNSNVFVNGMFPISEVEVEELSRHVKDLL